MLTAAPRAALLNRSRRGTPNARIGLTRHKTDHQIERLTCVRLIPHLLTSTSCWLCSGLRCCSWSGSQRSATRSVPRAGSSSEPWALPSIGMQARAPTWFSSYRSESKFRLVRVLALVAAVLAARAGRADGLAALPAITLAFTVQLISLLSAGPRRSDLSTARSGPIAGPGKAPSSLHQVLPCGDVQPVARRLAADGSSSWSAATESDTSCA